MNLALVAETYAPSVDSSGTYVDVLHAYPKEGAICPCCERKYGSKPKFVAHTKSSIHRRWLESLNNNKANYYVMHLEAQQQRQQLAKNDIEAARSRRVIEFLTNQLAAPPTTTNDLIDF
jgi:hypothetical protein